MSRKKKEKLHKEYCEIEECNVTDSAALEHHHIVFRSDGGNNNNMNRAVLCSNHHSLYHAGRLKIIGVFPSTGKYGRILVYVLDGKCNVEGIEEAYLPASNFKKKEKKA